MHTHSDPDNNIHIHHNGDYSGAAKIVIPLKSAPRDGENVVFDITDPHAAEYANLGMTLETYGITYEAVSRPAYLEVKTPGASKQSQWYAIIEIPAMVLVRFAASAVHDAMTNELEQMSLEDLLKKHL